MTAAEVVRQEVFEDLELRVIEEGGEEWFPAEEIGRALEFAEPRKTVLNLFNRNRDEFEGLYRVINLMTWLKSRGNLPYRLTVFNPQGAYLLAILARTPKSKALRRWLAKFMAHDLDKLRAHVQALEADRQPLTRRLWNLEKKMQYWRNKAQALKEDRGQAPLKALPPAATPEPYTFTHSEENPVVKINSSDLLRLLRAAKIPEFDTAWLIRLMDAQTVTPEDPDSLTVMAGLRALLRILNRCQLPN